jgi:hypothetical protein
MLTWASIRLQTVMTCMLIEWFIPFARPKFVIGYGNMVRNKDRLDEFHENAWTVFVQHAEGMRGAGNQPLDAIDAADVVGQLQRIHQVVARALEEAEQGGQGADQVGQGPGGWGSRTSHRGHRADVRVPVDIVEQFASAYGYDHTTARHVALADVFATALQRVEVEDWKNNGDERGHLGAIVNYHVTEATKGGATYPGKDTNKAPRVPLPQAFIDRLTKWKSMTCPRILSTYGYSI